MSSPKGLLFPTTSPVPTAMGSTCFVCSVSWGANSPSAPLVFVFVYAINKASTMPKVIFLEGPWANPYLATSTCTNQL